MEETDKNFQLLNDEKEGILDKLLSKLAIEDTKLIDKLFEQMISLLESSFAT